MRSPSPVSHLEKESCVQGSQQPICIDLFCGLGGWTDGFLAEGYRVFGFDIEQHVYGEHRYPGELVIQDVLTLHGSQFNHAACIVASPPCQAYSYMAQPWTRAKREIRWQEWERDSPFGDFHLNDLFNACFRIQREASKAAGHHIPMVVENVVGAQRWVGRAKWHYGSYYLWGDVPALMPHPKGLKNNGGSWFGQRDGKALERNDPRDMRRDENGEWVNAPNGVNGGHNHPGKMFDGRKGPGGDWFANGRQGQDACSDAVKSPGMNWSDRSRPAEGFNVRNAQRYREMQADRDSRKLPGNNSEDRWTDRPVQRLKDAVKHGGDCFNDPNWPGKQGGTKQKGSGPEWFDTGICKHSSRSDSRKAASALIAKIPFELSSHIARVYKP